VGEYGFRPIFVLGYQADAVREAIQALGFGDRVAVVMNEQYERGSVLSLWTAREFLEGSTMLMDADVFFEPSVLERLLLSPHENCFLLDGESSFRDEEYMLGVRNDRVVAMGRGLQGLYDLVGEWVGFVRLGPAATESLKQEIADTIASGKLDIGYEESLRPLLDRHTFRVERVDGLRWVEIDFPEDLRRAENLATQST